MIGYIQNLNNADKNPLNWPKGVLYLENYKIKYNLAHKLLLIISNTYYKSIRPTNKKKTYSHTLSY